MSTKVWSGSASGSAADAAATLVEGIKEGVDSPSLILLFASVEQGLGELQPIVSRAYPDAVVLGSSTAGEFTESGDTQGETVAVAVSGDFVVEGNIGKGLKDNVQTAVATALSGLDATHDEHPHRTAVVLLDTLAGRGEEAALLTSAMLGEDVTLAGGAAGDDKMETTWVGHNDTVATDAVAVAVIHSKKPFAVGVSHGHKPLSEPLTVTKAEGNVIHEIEDRPAWDVWVEHTREAALKRGIDPAELDDPAKIFDYLVVYEAGLTIGDTYKMRAPLLRGEDGSLTFACGVPEGTTFQIMQGLPEAQISSARDAANKAVSGLDGKAAGAIVFDCVCRKAILKDDFNRAVSAISDVVAAPVGGFETYGEIALEIGAMSGFHNTTTVVLALPE